MGRSSAPESVRPSTPPHSAAKLWLAALVIFAATFLTYSRVLNAGFIWDDAAHVTPPHLRSATGLGRIWKEPGAAQQYYPLLHTAFWVEEKLWGGSATGYHAANLALHAFAACLAGLVLRRLAAPGAFWAALIFALHPVQVESVAWISEQKNTLSAAFYFAAALAYLRFDSTRAWRFYVLAFGLFLCALLTKTVTATLPAALCVVLWWQRGRLDFRRDVTPLLPFLLLGIGAGLFTAWVERTFIGAKGAVFDLGFLERMLLAGRVVWFYAAKLLWPANLSFIYPRWEISSADPWLWAMLIAALAVTLGSWRLRNRTRRPLAAWLLFVGTLFPALGFFNAYPFQYSFAADHFQYLATLALIAPAAAGAATLACRFPFSGRVATIAAVGGLALLAHSQTDDYRDAPTLYRRTIARNPQAWMAHNNLGELLLKARPGDPEAIACFERALALRPAYAEAQNNLGLALTQSGRAREAIPHLEASLRLKPGAHQTHNNLGIALASTGRAEEAVRSFARAAELNPGLPNIHENWAKALLLLGRREEAAERFAVAARLREAAGLAQRKD
jgi:protein O-mannosyl-transferase